MSLRRGSYGPLARGDVHRNGDLEQLKARRIQRLEALGEVIQPEVADAIVAEFLEHLGLLLEVALLGVVSVNAEGKEGIRLCARTFGGARRRQQGSRQKQREAAEFLSHTRLQSNLTR